jgi:hypothetical protein
MDRSRSSAPQHSTAVRTAGSAALDLLLPAAAGELREPATAPPTGPAVSEASFFAGSPDLSVPTARGGHPPAQPRLEHRYYLHSDARRPPVPGRGDGLFSRFVLSWELSNTMETGFCRRGRPRFVSASPKSGTPIRARSSPRRTIWLR